jgi:hypothetical protein
MKTLFALGLCFSLSAFAASHKVLTVTSDRDQDITTLTIDTNGNGEATALKVTTSSNGIVVNTTTFTMEQARQGRAILFRADKHEVIRLGLEERFENIYGGPVKLDYLVNGIVGSRKKIALEAVREGDRWVVKSNGKTVTNAFVKINKVLGNPVGVSRITF